MYAISVPLGDKASGDESDYVIKEKEIVRFPVNMGISGYALKGNAVCFINDFALKC